MALVYIYHLAKFDDLMSCGSKVILKRSPCFMYQGVHYCFLSLKFVLQIRKRHYSFQKPLVVMKHWQKMHQRILEIFGIFKLLQKKLKLQLKFEKSCQTLVKYALGIEIFQNRLFFCFFNISNFAEDFRCFILDRI